MPAVNVTLIEGRMGSGKTNTATAFVVDAYHRDPSVRILANFHLFGIRYAYCGAREMLQMLDSGLVKEAIMIIDEAYIEGEARRGMNPLNVLLTWIAQQMRKRKIELYLIVQNGRFIDWRFRFIMSRRILCHYNEKSHMIQLTIKDIRKGTEKNVSYWAPQYWKYFNTDEFPRIPEKMIERALEWA